MILYKIFFLSIFFVLASCSNKNNIKKKYECSYYIVNIENKSIEELYFTNKLKQSIENKLNIFKDNTKKDVCIINLEYAQHQYANRISNTGSISHNSEKIIVKYKIEKNKIIIVNDSFSIFHSLKSSDYKYNNLIRKEKESDNKIIAISNKLFLSL